MKITITETAYNIGPVYRFFHGSNMGGTGSWIHMFDLVKYLPKEIRYNRHGIKDDIIGKEFEVDDSIANDVYAGELRC